MTARQARNTIKKFIKSDDFYKKEHADYGDTWDDLVDRFMEDQFFFDGSEPLGFTCTTGELGHVDLAAILKNVSVFLAVVVLHAAEKGYKRVVFNAIVKKGTNLSPLWNNDGYPCVYEGDSYKGRDGIVMPFTVVLEYTRF